MMKEPRANHGNIMPQRPRARHLSGVAAENGHWLRRGGLHFQFRLPRAVDNIYLHLGFILSADLSQGA